MRPRTRTLLALLLATSATVAFAVAPQSDDDAPDLATVPYMAEDPAGDANAVNGQGVAEDTVPATSSDPAQVGEGDILGARITSLFEAVTGADGVTRNVLTGLEFRTALSAEPTAASAPLVHRFMGRTGGCEFWVQGLTGTNGSQEHGTASVRLFDSCDVQPGPVADGVPVTSPLPPNETVTGDWVTWRWDGDLGEMVVALDFTAEDADSRLTDRVERGAFYQLDLVAVRANTGAVTTPVIDEMPGSNGFTVLGDDIPAHEPDPAPTPTSSPSPEPTSSPSPGSDPGVTPDRLVLGTHAPATGAAPLPTTSFEKASDLYWRWVTEAQGQQVLGRSEVAVEFRDDKHDPNSAGQVCKDLHDTTFLTQASVGTDEIQRCGQLANVAKVPYLSTGVTEAGLANNPWYFASSMTFKQQGGLLADYVAANPDGRAEFGEDAVIGTIITDTPNHKDALRGWNDGLQAQGLAAVDTFQHTRNDTSWIAATARSFREQGIEVVYFNSSPTMFVDFARTASSQFGYEPVYVGVGVTWGRNAMLDAGCFQAGDAVDGAIMLSPVPGLDAAPAEFHQATSRFDVPDDDVALLQWGAAEQLHDALVAYEAEHGTELTRADFRHFLEQGSAFGGGTSPTVTWTPDAVGHFGADTAHVLVSDCETRQFRTLHLHAAGF